MFNRQLMFFANAVRIGLMHKTLLPRNLTYRKYSSIISNMDIESKVLDSNEVKSSKKVKRLNYNDSILSNVMLQVKSKRLRNKSNLIFFEGKRLLQDALLAGIVPLQVFFSKTDDIKEFTFPEKTELLKVPYKDLELWSDLTTCPGIIAICNKPKPLENYKGEIPVSIICDNMREPGNLGALIRTATGCGVENVILSDGCVDLWESKVIRGGMGSHFRIPVYDEISWDDMRDSFSKDTLFLIATNRIKQRSTAEELLTVPYYTLSYSGHKSIAVVIGGETQGISKAAYELAKLFNYRTVTIPLSNKVESLNSVSALSVILYEIKRQFSMINDSQL